MDKKTKKKVLLGTGIVGAGMGIALLLKMGGVFGNPRVKIYKFAHAFDGFKVKLPKKIISTYSYPIKQGHVVTI